MTNLTKTVAPCFSVVGNIFFHHETHRFKDVFHEPYGHGSHVTSSSMTSNWFLAHLWLRFNLVSHRCNGIICFAERYNAGALLCMRHAVKSMFLSSNSKLDFGSFIGNVFLGPFQTFPFIDLLTPTLSYLMVQYHHHVSQPLDPILSQFNWIHIFTSCFYMALYLCVASSLILIKAVYAFLISCILPVLFILNLIILIMMGKWYEL